MKYTVTSLFSTDSRLIGNGLTALQAMREILTCGGYRYAFRRTSSGDLYLYHSVASENSTRGARHMRRVALIHSSKPGLAGQLEIAEQVIQLSHGLWHKGVEAHPEITESA